MTKTDMIKEICARVEGAKQSEVDEIIAAYTNVVKDVLTNDKDEKVPLPGIGSFSVKHVPERSGVSVLGGGKPWTKAAHDEITFKISKKTKEM